MLAVAINVLLTSLLCSFDRSTTTSSSSRPLKLSRRQQGQMEMAQAGDRGHAGGRLEDICQHVRTDSGALHGAEADKWAENPLWEASLVLP